MMRIDFYDKHLDFLALSQRLKTRLLTLEGTVRSSKTVIAIQAFFYRVYNSDNYLHLIAGRDFDTINNNILSGDMGMLTQFPDNTALKKDKIGGFYVELIGKGKSVKKIQIVGFNDKSKWTKILGGTIENIFVDEVNVANKQFIDECFARQVSFDYPLTIWTLNGDIPSHWVYEEYINRCKIISKAPVSIMADMDRFDKTSEWYYMHWVMADNPVMTAEKIARASSIYPIGSYYHTIKILGERGMPGDLIYLDYINEGKLICDIDINKYHTFGIGVDIGGKRAQNSFVLVGFNSDFTECGVIDKETFQQVGYKEKTVKLKSFVNKWINKCNIRYIAVDSAESNYIEDLAAEFKREGLPQIIPSDKATIKERIDLVILLMARFKIKFNNTLAGINTLNAFKVARWVEDKKGEEREDKNEWFNDVMDSVEYALTRYMIRLLRTAKMEVK